jgi:hypothetical protein
MYKLRFERQGRRLFAQIVAFPRIDGKVQQKRVGSLGSVLATEPIPLAERVIFWAGLGQRLAAYRLRHPGITEADEARFRRRLDQRIPEPRRGSDRCLALMTAIQQDVLTAFDTGDGDAVTDAIVRLAALARETQRQTEEA